MSPNPHTRFLQIKAFYVTTSNSGNFEILFNISLTDFIHFASNSVISLKSMVLRRKRYLILISSKPSISDITTSKLRDLQWKLINFREDSYFWLKNTWRALLKHSYSIFTESSYQIPPNQGFSCHHFELRELQGIMQYFSYRFYSFRFQFTNIA